jgi:PAS domain S-box-containing protein
VGQAAQARETIYYHAPGQFRSLVDTGFTQVAANVLLVMPLLQNDEVVGVLELTATKPLSQAQYAFIEQLAKAISANLLALRNQEHINRLYQEAQNRQEQLQAQEEEMRQNLEELEATQEEMQRTNRELEATIRAMNLANGVAEFDLDGTLLKANGIYRQLLALPEGTDQDSGWTLRALLQPTQDYEPEALWQQLAAGQSHSGEYALRTVDHNTVWVSGGFFPVSDKNGQVKKLMQVAVDMTQTKRQQQEIEQQNALLATREKEMAEKMASLRSAEELNQSLEEANEFNRLVFDTAQEAIGVVDGEDATFSDCNPKTLALMGLSERREFLGKTPADFTAEYQRDGEHRDDFVPRVVKQALEQGGNSFYWRFLRADGAQRDAYVHLSSFTFRGRQKLQFAFQDYTDQLKAEENARLREAIVENSRDALGLLDGYHFVEANQAYAEIFGANDPSEIIGQTPEPFSPEFQPDGSRSSEAAEREIGKAIEKGAHHFEWRHRKLTGEEFDAEVFICTLEYEGKTLLQSNVRDITERKQKEQELRLKTAIFDNTQEAVTLIQGNEYIEANQAQAELYGCNDPSEVVGKTPIDFSPEYQPNGGRSAEEAPKRIQEALDSGVNRFEWMHCTKQGEPFETEVFLSPYEHEGQAIIQATMRDITERKQKEQELRQQRDELQATEEELRQNMEELEATQEQIRQANAEMREVMNTINSTSAVLELDFDRRIHTSNAVIAGLLGYSREELDGKLHRELVPQEVIDSGAYDALWAQLLQGQEVTDEFEQLTKSGERICLRGSYYPVRDADGQLTKVLKIANDVTAEKQQARENEHLSMVARYTDNAVLITGADGRLQWANEGFHRITGYTVDEAIGQKPGHLLQGPNTDPATVARIRQCLANEQSFTEEIVNYTKRGRPYWIELKVSPVYDEAGQLSQFIAIESDITDRKYTEQSLQEAQEQLRWQVDTLNEAAIVSETDEQGNIIFVNQKFCEISGYSEEEVLGENHNIVNSGYHSKAFWKEMWRTAGRGQPFHALIRNQAKDGSYYWVDSTIKGVLDENGRPVKYVAVRFDVKDRIRAEEHMRQQSEAMQAHEEELREHTEAWHEQQAEVTRLQAELQQRTAALQQAMAVLEMAPDGTVLSANDRMLALVNTDRDTLIGTPARQYLGGPADAQEAEALWQELQQGRTCQQTHVIVDDHGQQQTLPCNYNPVMGRDGQLQRVLVFGAPAHAMASSSTATGVPDAVQGTAASAALMTFDNQGYLQHCNTAAEQLWRCSFEAMRELALSQLLPPGVTQSGEYKQLWTFFREGQNAVREWEVCLADDTRRTLRFNFRPYVNQQGKLLQLAVLMADRTAHQAEEEALFQSVLT